MKEYEKEADAISADTEAQKWIDEYALSEVFLPLEVIFDTSSHTPILFMFHYICSKILNQRGLEMNI